jgi:hypothetical protein
MVGGRRGRGRPTVENSPTPTPESVKKRQHLQSTFVQGDEEHGQKALGGCLVHQLFCQGYLDETLLSVALMIKKHGWRWLYHQGFQPLKSHGDLWEKAYLNIVIPWAGARSQTFYQRRISRVWQYFWYDFLNGQTQKFLFQLCLEGPLGPGQIQTFVQHLQGAQERLKRHRLL